LGTIVTGVRRADVKTACIFKRVEDFFIKDYRIIVLYCKTIE